MQAAIVASALAVAALAAASSAAEAATAPCGAVVLRPDRLDATHVVVLGRVAFARRAVLPAAGAGWWPGGAAAGPGGAGGLGPGRGGGAGGGVRGRGGWAGRAGRPAAGAGSGSLRCCSKGLVCGRPGGRPGAIAIPAASGERA